MRILLVIEPSGGGSGRHVVDLAHPLIGSGHQVYLIWSPRRAEPWFEAGVAALPLHANERLPMRRRVGPWDVAALHALNRLIARLGPFEIVHGHSAKAGALVRLAHAPGAAKIYTPHALPMMGPASPATIVAGAAEALLARSGDAIISEEEAAVARRWGLGGNRLHIVPNGLAAPPANDRLAARQTLGVPEDALVVGFVGRLCAQKDPVRFAQAVHRANAIDPRIIGVMIGDGDLAPSVRTAGGDALRLLGARDAGPLMAGFDLFAMTSRYEADSYAMIEAAALGLPIVCTDVGGIARLTQTGARIDRLPVDASPDHLAEAMRAALASRVVPLPIAPGLLSATRMADQTVRIYRDAFARRRLGG
ncbi:glycosyltransferase involved in cell wall biosynthesis [Brevundimonas vesicularis]|uniref:Glycosyltransferase involved in cell wall biosynthesis n=1 Tax=Brevundimonas vesicularis TaxID=41276 RepID=A0A7W9FRK5_BREVE|nr:glycosyltransferase family 4 protein [Brevundimonas vesicularis]MBB5770228.1 glycosyltransferase involved in cell wall biosynthesis [Brevundimonas vesicularis]